MKTALSLLIATLLSTVAATSFAQGPRETMPDARHHHVKKHHVHRHAHHHTRAENHARTR